VGLVARVPQLSMYALLVRNKNVTYLCFVAGFKLFRCDVTGDICNDWLLLDNLCVDFELYVFAAHALRKMHLMVIWAEST
jgi:hypothetical protein